jgi:lysyl-tRNA synthetase class II
MENKNRQPKKKPISIWKLDENKDEVKIGLRFKRGKTAGKLNFIKEQKKNGKLQVRIDCIR